MPKCKNCGKETLEEFQAFCWDKPCRNEYNEKSRQLIKERKELPLNYRQALSYVWHTLANPTDTQLKETARYYDCDTQLLKNVLYLAEACKDESRYKKEIILTKIQLSNKHRYEQKKFRDIRNVRAGKDL